MEYTQITLDEWVSIKDQIKKDIFGVQESFVRIGYNLRRIKEQELYKQDGHTSLSEFALKEYGLSPTSVSRFMKINERYSVDGNSPNIRVEFADLGQSKLVDMLSLPETDIEMITSDTKREDIRELKKFNKEASEEPVESNTSEFANVIIGFYKANRDALNDLYSADTDDIDELVDIINPSGSKSFKQGIYFLMMGDADKGIQVKKYPDKPYKISWGEFIAMTHDIFKDSAAGNQTYKNYFGEEVKEEPKKEENQPKVIAEQPKEQPKKDEPKKPVEKPKVKVQETAERRNAEQIAPAQKIEEKQPEIVPKTEEIIEKVEGEVIENTEVLPVAAVEEVKTEEIKEENTDKASKDGMREDLEKLKRDVMKVAADITRVDGINWKLIIDLIDEKLIQL